MKEANEERFIIRRKKNLNIQKESDFETAALKLKEPLMPFCRLTGVAS